MNNQGLRDPERPVKARPGTLRILALGDSFVEGYTVPLGETVTQVLEASLRRQGCPAEVINGGTAAYSTDQEYIFYRTEGVRYAPRIVALFFYYNDILFNARPDYFGTPKPVFEVAEGRLVLRNSPVPPPPPASPEKPSAATPSGSRSAFLQWVEERTRRGWPQVHDLVARTGLWEPIRPREPTLQLKVYKRKALPELEDAWERTGRILEALAREVEARGGRVLVAYVPSRMEVSEGDWLLTRLEYGMDEHWDRGYVVARLFEVARAAGVNVLDLTPAMRRAQGSFRGPYLTFDGHWNALGHKTAAREVEAFLRTRGWLSDCQPPTSSGP